MALAIGARLGPYEILSAIGAGGMGEVYRARDTRLKREVAIKVLPEALSQDPQRLGRFQREAELLAMLNHPNVAHIHGLEESDGRNGAMGFSAKATTKDAACFRRRRSCTPPRFSSTLQTEKLTALPETASAVIACAPLKPRLEAARSSGKDT